MAQKFLSPGVFTREIDQSFLAQGVAGIGAAVVGRTLKGPAFVPTLVQGFDDFAQRFGGKDKNHQLPYAAQNYLQNAAGMTVVRVLGSQDGASTNNGYSLGNITALVDSASNGQALAVVHAQYPISVAGVALDANNFVVQIKSGSSVVFAATASFLTSSQNYVGKVLNTDPTLYTTYGHYLYTTYGYAKPAASASWAIAQVSGGSTTFYRDYSDGATTSVKSQPLGGIEFDLFSFVNRNSGRAGNHDIKVEIGNVKPSANPLATPYGTFDVLVRDFNDTDQHVTALEQFVGCTLDPNAASYIGRRIGDMYETFDTSQRKFLGNGTFPAQSKLIRVVLNVATNAPPQALPWGFRGYAKIAYVSSSAVPSFTYTPSQVDRNGNLDTSIVWGVNFFSGSVADRMRADPDNSLSSTDADFSLGFLSASWSNNKQVYTYNTALPTALTAQYQPIYGSGSLQSFCLPFQGGFNGWDLRVKDPLYLQNVDDETVTGVVSAKRGVDTLANPDAFDMNLLAVPGVHNLKVADHARSMVNDRMDALYVMDVTGSSVAEVIGNLANRQLDDNYTACYYPDLKLNDLTNNVIVRVSPSVAVLGAISFSDRVGQPWFAPAGLNRGGLNQFNIIDVADRLTFQDRNDLYDNRINPIATFPNEGITVFGQKTLQVKASALDRINVRRLLIFAKKTVASAAKYLVFEPDNPATWQRFTNLVNPILNNIQVNQGLNRFKVVMDSTTNTPDVVDRNVMVGKIFLQPTKTAEFIDLSFIVTNSGVTFGS